VVDCFWILEAEGSGAQEPIMPDGRIEIVFHYGVRFDQRQPGGRVERQPASTIVGQMLAPISVGYLGRAGVAAIRPRRDVTGGLASVRRQSDAAVRRALTTLPPKGGSHEIRGTRALNSCPRGFRLQAEGRRTRHDPQAAFL
jgi:hypothetical protein